MNSLKEKNGFVRKPQLSAEKSKARERKVIIVILVTAIIIIALIWIWKDSQMGNVREQAKLENQKLVNRAKTSIATVRRENLMLLAMPYVWTVRSELLKGNVNQVNLYSNEMVKEKNFQNILVANDKGIIISSTNKKNEGKEFTSVGKPDFLSSDTTVVENINESTLVMTSPIMGFNKKLGTLMITYKAPPLDLK